MKLMIKQGSLCDFAFKCIVCSVFDVLVFAEHLDNILLCHYSKYSKIVFEYESLAIFAENTQKYPSPIPQLYDLLMH